MNLLRRLQAKGIPVVAMPDGTLVVAAGGEGSRGGNIIGHTSSGKPIYETGNRGKKAEDFTSEDHREAHKLHNREVDKLLEHHRGPTVSKDVAKKMERLRQHSQHHLKESKKPKGKFQ